ncbi:LCP family protein [Chungangia koreensis]|uniref:Regulatory protein MsrR n=1 Tax=Chungangia koreensis TaxID=752657 RepID=A0ABV8X9F8_9LACT
MEIEHKETRTGRRKRRFRFGRFFFLILLLSVVGMATFSVLQYREGSNLAGENGASEDEDFTGDTKDPKYMHIENILLIGVDDDGSGKSRSDTMIVASWNKDNDTVKLISFMRDIYADIPRYESYKLNTAYYLDGVQLLKDTLTGMFGIPIHHYALIDFDNFETLIDIAAPNGVEVNVEKEMSEKIGVTLMPGTQQLSGKELLGYARFRADQEGDFGRVARQQKVIEALKEELLSPSSLPRIPKLAGAVNGYIQTDLTTGEEIRKVIEIMAGGGLEIDKMTVPVEGSYSFASYSHAGSVIELDLDQNKQAISKFIGMPLR